MTTASTPSEESPPKAGGKGRPTPKRNEARKARVVTPAPKNRKEASKQNRDRRRIAAAEARAALKSGDISKLPPRDAGPERAFVRDYVDSRRNGGGLFLPAAIVYLICSSIPVAAVRVASFAVWLVSILVVFGDSVRLSRAIARTTKERFPKGAPRGLAWYGISRTTLPRRFRLPPPRVSRGDTV